MVENFSERLAAAMKAAGMDITALSKGVGVSYQAVKKALEGGKFKAENNIKAAEVLGVNSEWLATGRGPRARSGAVASPPPRPSERFDNLSADEQRFVLDMRDIQVDEEQYKELLTLVAERAAKMRAMRERILATAGLGPTFKSKDAMRAK